MRTHSDIMVLANQAKDPGHPFWYARVIGIFHAIVSRVGSGSAYKQMDFLWVHWYGLDMGTRSGFKALMNRGALCAPKDAFSFIFAFTKL